MKEVTVAGKQFTIKKLKAPEIAEIHDLSMDFVGARVRMKIGTQQLETCKQAVVKIVDGDTVIDRSEKNGKEKIAEAINDLYEDEYSELFIEIDNLAHPTADEVKN